MVIDNFSVCPECSSDTVRDEVDIGVGTMHGPARCDNCGWTQETKIQETMKRFGIKEG